jgi:hypothetical protein
MQIEISRKVDPNKIGLIHDAVNFYANMLIHGNTRKILSISIEEIDKRSAAKGFSGSIEWNDDWINPRDFTIRITSSKPMVYILETIAHEMVHLRQFVTGDLKHRFRGGRKILWKNQIINTKDFSYDKLPWEQQAYYYQHILTREFINYYESNL